MVLDKCINEIVRRHESLRTTFSIMNGVPYQVIVPELSIELSVVDLKHITENEKEEEARRLAREEARTPFNLSTGPLLRSKLLHMDVDEYVFLFTSHHIVSDGWSAAALYDAYSNDMPSPLPELPIQYADFSIWQRQWLQGDVLAKHLTFWKDHLGDETRVLELPTDHPRSELKTFRESNQSFVLPRNLVDRLEEISRKEKATLFMVLLSAFNVLLHRYTGQKEIIVGAPIANRNHADRRINWCIY
jgi:hypothetical protein